MKRPVLQGMALLVTLALWGATAMAHVTVWPQQSSVSAWEKYTMRVPTEQDDPTVKVVLKIPEGVTFEQYRPLTGWSVSTQTDGSHRVVRVTWTATAGGLLPGQFEEFEFVAKNPQSPGEVAWDAYQFYKNGDIVEWTGGEGAQTPHSITRILAASPGE